MQLEEREPRGIAELATAAVTELPPGYCEQYRVVVVGDHVALCGCGVALWSHDKGRLGLCDVLAAQSEWAAWCFKDGAGFGGASRAE